MQRLADCPGLHVAPEQPGCVAVRWMRETRRSVRARVVAHTCDHCSPLAYELCASGGLLFVRRTDRSGDRPEIRETERLPDARARRMWLDLLLGRAR
ncbi:hypothetical protein GCM10010116_24190 [Microbispora rosea subsp. aerata]|nr:hypothetical protein GCM10010116_24190 [Microbispora rosea subsp. aerata]GIH55652.1 hypothetical protein Mro02_25660 [Microbispora rosea subsp. aerata]GLJ86050.1 hypothetical protein GCM10017588_47830 [Microbispora rosea subsp. aerata]